MSDFSATGIALGGCFPTNKMILDDKGMPGIYVVRPKKVLSDLLDTSDTTVHPAFVINNTVHDKLYIGKFEGVLHNSRIYSLPAEDPKVYITHDQFVQYCRNKGMGHHYITAAEWAYLALLCKKNGTQPLGNNDYGKDVSETSRMAIPTYTYDDNGVTRIGRVATGTGPKTWSDTHDLDGIFDLNGNVWEWTAGIRVVYGEVQVIPYNNAAASGTDMSANSTAWRAINAKATSYSDLYITPNGSGTTANSVKLDFVNSHWQFDTSITTQEDKGKSGLFQNTTYSDNISDFAKLYLQAMALGPVEGDTDYGSDNVWGNNGAAERCVFRGASWIDRTSAGVFNWRFDYPRSHSNRNIGGRPAFYE